MGIINWWALLKIPGEGTIGDISNMGIISEDGVHLTYFRNRSAAVFLCNRLMDGSGELSDLDSVSSKRSKME